MEKETRKYPAILSSYESATGIAQKTKLSFVRNDDRLPARPWKAPRNQSNKQMQHNILDKHKKVTWSWDSLGVSLTRGKVLLSARSLFSLFLYIKK